MIKWPMELNNMMPKLFQENKLTHILWVFLDTDVLWGVLV